MESLYDILEVNESSTSDEIKKSYARLIRLNPPEKKPEEFKKIRHAYEILYSDKSRREYDINYKYGNDIKRLLDEAYEFMDKENYDEAIKNFKKVLIVNPELGFVLNFLGVCFIRINQYSDAAKYFERALALDPGNDLYYRNYAYSLRNLREYDRAIVYYQKSIDINPLEKEGYKELAFVYMDMAQYDKVIDIINKAIDLDGKRDFNDIEEFLYLNDAYVLIRDIDGLKNNLNTIEMIVPEEDDEKKWTAGMLIKKAIDYKKYNLYNEACILYDTVIKIFPDEKVFKLHDETIVEMKVYEELKKMKSDSRVRETLYLCIYMLLRKDYEIEDKSERDKALSNVMSNLIADYNANAKDFKSSIEVIKNDYPVTYKRFYEFFQNILSEIDDITGENQNKPESASVMNVQAPNLESRPDSTKYDASNKKTTSNNTSSSGCLMLILMIIGFSIGGPAGLILGIIIGVFILSKN